MNGAHLIDHSPSQPEAASPLPSASNLILIGERMRISVKSTSPEKKDTKYVESAITPWNPFKLVLTIHFLIMLLTCKFI